MTSGQTLARQVASNVAVLGAGSGLAQVLMAVALLVTARELGQEVFGAYAAILAAVGMLGVLFNHGVDTWLMREAGRDPDVLPANLANGWLLKSLLAVPWLALVIVTAPRWGGLSSVSGLVAVAAIGIIGDGWTSLSQSTFKGLLRNRATATLQLASALTLLAATVALAAGRGGLPEFIAARAAISLAVGAAGVVWAARTAGWQPAPAALGRVWSGCRPFFLSDALVQVYMKADIAMVAWLAGSVASGEYAPAATVVNALFVIPAVLYGVLLPVFSRLVSQDAAGGAGGAVRASLAAGGLLGLGLFGGLYVFAGPVVLLVYGGEFAGTAPVLAVLSSLLLFKCPSFALAAWLVASGRQNRRVVVQVAVAVVNLALNLALIPVWGAMGAAWAYVASEAVLCGGYALASLPAARGARA